MPREVRGKGSGLGGRRLGHGGAVGENARRQRKRGNLQAFVRAGGKGALVDVHACSFLGVPIVTYSRAIGVRDADV